VIIKPQAFYRSRNKNMDFVSPLHVRAGRIYSTKPAFYFSAGQRLPKAEFYMTVSARNTWLDFLRDCSHLSNLLIGE
jgi:hypothetical protein